MESFPSMLQYAIESFHKEGPYSNSFAHIYAYGEVDNQYVYQIQSQLEQILKRNDESSNKNNVQALQTTPKPIVLHIHSPGGLLNITISLVQYMRNYPIPIIGYAEGYVISAASIIFRCCHYRVMGPYSNMLIHQLSLGFHGKKEELDFQGQETDILMDHLLRLLDPPSKSVAQSWIQLLKHDIMLSTKKTVEYKLCDATLESHFMNDQKHTLKDIKKEDIPYFITNYNTFHKFPLSDKIMSNPDLFSKFQYFDSVPFSMFVQKMHDPPTNYLYNPILLHFYSSEYTTMSMVQPMINIIMGSQKPILSLLSSVISDYSILPFIACPYRIMYPYSYVIINFTKASFIHERQEDMKLNIKMSQEWIRKMFRLYTKVPESILNDLFKRPFMFQAKECLKYGMCDIIYENDMSRDHEKEQMHYHKKKHMKLRIPHKKHKIHKKKKD
jgi:ATP-dependent protease ClpP protease subunit